MLTMTKDDYEKILAHCKEGLAEQGLWSDRRDKRRRRKAH